MATRTRWSDMDKRHIPLKALREAYSVYNRTTGKSPATVRWYDDKLALFERFVGNHAMLADVNVSTVRDYVADLQGRQIIHENNVNGARREGSLSSSYIQGFVRALRAFASWLHHDGYTDTNVLKVLKPPKVQQKVTEILTDEETTKLLAVFDQDDPFGARNYAIVLTFLDCGLRASELCFLRTEDAHLDQGYLKVLGKGNKERLVPIGRHCQDALLAWREHFRPQFAMEESPYLFLNANGVALNVDAVDEVVKKAGAKVGVARVHCHLLRHTFATEYLCREVGDPLRLQQILGHTSLEMVRRYVAAANVQKSLIERHSSPMDLVLAKSAPDPKARRVQPRRPRPLHLVK